MKPESRKSKKPLYGVDDKQLAEWPLVFREDLFAGKTVLVSGAGSGLGKAIAYTFARLGANIVICGRNADRLEISKKWIESFGVSCDSHQMTIRDPEQVKILINNVFSKYGTLDILINNAGGQFPQPAIDFSIKGWNAVIDTNLNGTWYMMQASAQKWRQLKACGCIVNIVAVFERGNFDLAHTCAARAGVSYLSKTVAVEWAPLKIRVNCVAPGVVETEGFNVYPEEAARRYKTEPNPLLRAGDAMDVAEATVYLAGPSGKFINGETINVDGGQRMWGEVWSFKKPDWAKLD